MRQAVASLYMFTCSSDQMIIMKQIGSHNIWGEHIIPITRIHHFIFTEYQFYSELTYKRFPFIISFLLNGFKGEAVSTTLQTIKWPAHPFYLLIHLLHCRGLYLNSQRNMLLQDKLLQYQYANCVILWIGYAAKDQSVKHILYAFSHTNCPLFYMSLSQHLERISLTQINTAYIYIFWHLHIHIHLSPFKVTFGFANTVKMYTLSNMWNTQNGLPI